MSEPRVLDVRPIIKAGLEPFDTIMQTVGELAEDQDLIVIAPFEPVPLEGVLSGQGFSYQAVPLEQNEWQVTFTRNAG
ncbi:MAG: DUF2249 domain-containing protein [Actinobacteria bacterium]|jgi:uncharacterized protein (DUF2249 family)|nr:DUF2249 domain-containing protein [Actinomycetota bacterium]MCL6104854.1 DUF2249 domain-containing protein [Actinomycetota bacterium]